jgi:hypothetical protein
VSEGWREKFRTQALQAVTKRATYGNDITLATSSVGERHTSLDEHKEATPRGRGDVNDVKVARTSRWTISPSEQPLQDKGLEYCEDVALQRHEWLRDYYWKAPSYPSSTSTPRAPS